MFMASCDTGARYVYKYKGKTVKTRSIYHPYISTCTYMNGYWGNWQRDNWLRCICESFGPQTIITYYQKYNHPGEYEYRIELEKYIGPDGSWNEYSGRITIKRENENKLKQYYKKHNFNHTDSYWTFPCKIKMKYKSSLPDCKYISPEISHYQCFTYNIYYNGVGRAFTIDGSWHNANDWYDPWY